MAGQRKASSKNTPASAPRMVTAEELAKKWHERDLRKEKEDDASAQLTKEQEGELDEAITQAYNALKPLMKFSSVDFVIKTFLFRVVFLHGKIPGLKVVPADDDGDEGMADAPTAQEDLMAQADEVGNSTPNRRRLSYTPKDSPRTPAGLGVKHAREYDSGDEGSARRLRSRTK